MNFGLALMWELNQDDAMIYTGMTSFDRGSTPATPLPSRGHGATSSESRKEREEERGWAGKRDGGREWEGWQGRQDKTCIHFVALFHMRLKVCKGFFK